MTELPLPTTIPRDEGLFGVLASHFTAGERR
jgi:hypothetical protein